MLEVGSGPQVPTFRISTYWNLQVGLTRNLGARRIDPITSLKVKTTKREGVGLNILIRSTSGVKGHFEALEWGLGLVISRPIIHMDMYKPNNKLVSA